MPGLNGGGAAAAVPPTRNEERYDNEYTVVGQNHVVLCNELKYSAVEMAVYRMMCHVSATMKYEIARKRMICSLRRVGLHDSFTPSSASIINSVQHWDALPSAAASEVGSSTSINN